MSEPLKIRTPRLTIEKILSIEKETDTRKALKEVINLFENYPLTEERVATEYSETDGKPLKYKWKPKKEPIPKGGKRLNDCHIITDSNIPNERLSLSPNVFSDLKEKGTIAVHRRHHTFAFVYETVYHPGCDDSHGCTGSESYNSEHIRVLKVEEIK